MVYNKKYILLHKLIINIIKNTEFVFFLMAMMFFHIVCVNYVFKYLTFSYYNLKI